MSYCSKCGFPIDPADKFCRGCGTPVAAEAPAAPAYTQPEYSYNQPSYDYNQPSYDYNQPVYAYEQPQSTGSKAGAFIGMGLGIGGLFFALIGLINVLANLDYDAEFAFGMAVGFGIFSLPLSIIGMILGGKNSDCCKAGGAGKGLGLAGVIISGVMLFLGFVSMMS